MSDVNKWYLAGMVNAADKSEFKEDEHPRGKGGMFVKKGEGGGCLSALEEVYKKGGFKHPEALAKADFEELGKMSDSRLDAEITMLKGKVEEGGKPLDKARLEAANGIMKGRKSTKNNSLVGLSDEMLEGAVRYGTSMLNDDKVSPKDKEEAKRIIERAKAELAKRGKSEPTLKFKKGDKVKVPNREGVHEITGIVDSMWGGKLYEVDNDHSVGYSESEISNVGKNDSVMGGKSGLKKNSELYSLISQDSGKFDELESEVMLSVGKNIKESTAAQKSGNKELAKQKMKLAQEGQRDVVRFTMIRQLNSFKNTADQFHVEGNTYMEKAYRKITEDYRKRFEQEFGEI